MSKRTGLIFHGPVIIGFFHSFTSEDCFGSRQISCIENTSDYLIENYVGEILRFVYSEYTAFNEDFEMIEGLEIIEDFGYYVVNLCTQFDSRGIYNIDVQKCSRPE